MHQSSYASTIRIYAYICVWVQKVQTWPKNKESYAAATCAAALHPTSSERQFPIPTGARQKSSARRSVGKYGTPLQTPSKKHENSFGSASAASCYIARTLASCTINQLKELVMRFLGLISMSQHISKSRETVVGPEPWSWTHAPPCTSLSNPPWTRCDLLASLPYTSANEWRTFWRQDATGTSNGNLMGLIWEYLRAPLQHCICRDLKNFRKSHCFCSGLRSLLHMHCCPTIVARTCPVPR